MWTSLGRDICSRKIWDFAYIEWCSNPAISFMVLLVMMGNIIIPVEVYIKKLPEIEEGSLPIYSYVAYSVIIRTNLNSDDRPLDKVNIISVLKNKIKNGVKKWVN